MTRHASAAQAQAWEQPGTLEVAPGVHRIPLPLPNDSLRAVNVYVLLDGDTATLVDAGWAKGGSRDRLKAALRDLDLRLSDIGRFLITHAHRDHYTLGVAIRRDLGTRLSLGAGERPAIEALMSDRPPLTGQLQEMRRCGAHDLVARLEQDPYLNAPGTPGLWEPPDDWLEPGTLRLDSGRTLEVIKVPGHTQGHVIFHDTEHRLLFTGDHILPSITPSIAFEPVVPASPLSDYLESLATVRKLPDALLLPAHGPVAPSVHDRVDELLDHHRQRLARTETVLRAGSRTARDVAARLPWTKKERALDSMDVFNQMLAIAETNAHLTVLVSQGRATCRTSNGVLIYQAS